jgi:hypothetical protein
MIKVGICTQCGNEVKRIASHHIIPIWCGGKDEDRKEVCVGCHTRLENMFKNFVFYGSLEKPKSYANPEKVKINKHNDYIRRKDKISAQRKTPEFRAKQRSWFKGNYGINREEILDKQAQYRLNNGITKKSIRLEKKQLC